MAQSRFVATFLLVAGLCVPVGCSGQGVHPVSGRQFAGVMGPGGADWLVRPERLQEEEPDKALDAIGIERGSTVADVGAGVGYFTGRLGERVGPQGVVYGEDIQPSMLEQLRRNVRQRGLSNVKLVLGDVDDPKLPKGELDLVLMVDVYHEFSEPQKMLRGIREGLKPGGRLVLIEYRGEDARVPIRPEHKMTVKQVRTELEPEGFRFEKSLEVLPWQHILIFRK
jgi:ubiquinone/menaquinone biosynthesis C-methylase UbiE